MGLGDVVPMNLGIGHQASGIGHRASGIGRRASEIGNRKSGISTDPAEAPFIP